MKKILTEAEKSASALQILDGLRNGSIDENEALDNLAGLTSGEGNSDIAQFLSDTLSISRSLVLRPVNQRQSEPLLVAAVSGLKSRGKQFLVAEPAAE